MRIAEISALLGYAASFREVRLQEYAFGVLKGFVAPNSRSPWLTVQIVHRWGAMPVP